MGHPPEFRFEMKKPATVGGLCLVSLYIYYVRFGWGRVHGAQNSIWFRSSELAEK